jgi:hypothetical protein
MLCCAVLRQAGYDSDVEEAAQKHIKQQQQKQPKQQQQASLKLSTGKDAWMPVLMQSHPTLGQPCSAAQCMGGSMLVYAVCATVRLS